MALGNALLASGGSSDPVAVQHHPGAPTGPPNGDSADDYVPDIQTVEPSRALLLNKIDRLQRTNVRLIEKVDFMREHAGQLTQELQKKTQLIQVCLLLLINCF